MGPSEIVEWIGDSTALTLGGLLVGLAFGALAQRSRFCLRAAIIEFARGSLGVKVAIWTLAFSTAVAVTQGAIVLGMLEVGGSRQLAGVGSLSGAVIGGLLFGAGMVLARGCASRLLVLSATGNMRALVTGLILTVVAQASLRGVLSPLRETLGALWLIEGGPQRSILSLIGTGPLTGFLAGGAFLAVGLWIARANRIGIGSGLAAIGVGASVAGGWLVTYGLSRVAFAPVAISSVTFTGPSADTLMGLINSRSIPVGFDIGLVPGVFLGSFAAAAFSRELELQGFEGGRSMLRYIAGAILMGFGGMLAGGCAVGAGVSGGAVFALTGWLALASMWVSAAAVDFLVDRPSAEPAPIADPRTDATRHATVR